MKRITKTSDVYTEIGAKFGQCYLCGSSGLHISHLLCENVDESLPDSVEIVCKECSSRRRKRPISAYLNSRFSEVATEFARISLLLAPKAHISGISTTVSNITATVVSESTKDMEKLHYVSEKSTDRHKQAEEDGDGIFQEWSETLENPTPISQNTESKSEVTKRDLKYLVDNWDE